MLPRRVRAGLAVALTALAGWAVARWRGTFRIAVEGESMAPTLLPGQFLIATRAGRLRRGDVVVVKTEGREVVKRVVGLPGEFVRVSGDAVDVDGRRLHEPYASGRGPSGEWTLGRGEYLVLGDRRDRSTDGRAFGPVSEARIPGVVRLRYWPRVERLG